MKKTYSDLMAEIREGSPNTSVNQVAGGFKKVKWISNSTNLDIGGGKYEKATEFLLNNHNVTNLVFDPFNRSSKHNKEIMSHADEKSITSTLFNVLNVIPEKKDRIKVLIQAKRKHTKNIYITVYEKGGDGNGHQTTKGWQNSMKLKDYLPEIQSVYSNAVLSKGMITINI